ncbi:MAG: PhnD/SsuA/transferrin family substrate-binding protein [Planctomycetota bacterium]
MDIKPRPIWGRSSTGWRSFALILPIFTIGALFPFGCKTPEKRTSVESDGPNAATQPTYDTTAPKPVAPRDRLERQALNREGGLRSVDRLMDKRTPLPPFDRPTLPPLDPDQKISEGVPLLDDRDPFAEPPPLPPKEVTIHVGIGRSTYKTREREEVLSAIQPFIDLVHREVNIRGEAQLHESADEMFYSLLDGKNQLAACNVFEYLIIRDWLASKEDNGTVLLATATPAHPRTENLDADFVGTLGSSIELIVAADSIYKKPKDLKSARLALAANLVPAPGAFLTRLLADLGHPRSQPFFSSVALRRYPKDCVIDVLKGKADVACVDQGTVGALCRFYGIQGRIRTLAVSPRYNVDALFTSANNLATHREEIELTQRQLTTLGKDPEGQEVLFFFDVEGWSNYRDDDIATPRAHYADYLKFLDETPVDLLPLLDPKALVDRRTYDRFGDE